MNPPPDIARKRTEQRQKWLWWTIYFVGCCAFVTATASFLITVTSSPFMFAFQLALGFWGFYALAAPVVVWFAGRFPLNRKLWPYHLVIHLAGTFIFITFCEVGFGNVIYKLEPRTIEIMAKNKMLGEPLDRRSLGDLAEDLEGGLPKPSLRIVVITKLLFSIVLYWGLVGTTHLLAAMTVLREREKQSAQLAVHLTQAQLAGLRTQLQPHFLFNTLNSIAALIPRNSQLATEMVMNLSDLLRMTLRDPHRGQISLGEELKLLHHYVDIQKLRFGERLAFHVDVTEDALNAFVPPLLLQPLVENAIRHGLEASDQTERITVRGNVADQELHLEVVNTFRTESDESRPSANSTGVGLANTRARLEVQYGDDQHFEAGPLVDGGFRVTMRILIRTETQQPFAPNAD